MHDTLSQHGYQQVKTPLLFNKGLWEISGHWGKYRENMFLEMDSESGEHGFSLKPVNCPSHHLLYASKKHSHRELPMSRCACCRSPTNVADDAQAFVDQLRAAGIRATLDAHAGTLNYKIREAETLKVPYMAVIGGREAEAGTAAVRVRGAGKKQVILTRESLVEQLRTQTASRSLELGVD